MGNYFTDVWNILIFFWEIGEKVWFWTSPIIVPLILPAWAIYLIRKNKKVLKIPGSIYLVLALLWTVVWIYMYLRAGNFHYHPTPLEAIKGVPACLEILAFFYIGVYASLGKRWWVKILGILAALFGFIWYCAIVFIGTP